MTQVVDSNKSLIAAWLRRAQHSEHPRCGALWLDTLRDSAKTAFQQLGIPTARDEPWRFTNVAPLIRIPFQRAEFAPGGLSQQMIEEACMGQSAAHQLVFVNGHFDERLSSIGLFPAGVVLSHLSAAGGADFDWIENSMGQFADFRQHAFSALNTACFEDAAVLLLPQGAVIEKPIQLLFVSTAGAEPTLSHPRVLIVANAGSQATILESYIGLAGSDAGAGPCFTNSVTEIVLNETAAIEYCRLQDEDETAFHIGLTQVQLGAESRFHSHVVSSGGKLARHELNVVLDGEGAECSLNGLAVARGRQLIDNQTLIEHVRPRCTSRELYKTVVDDKAHGVFSGKIHVHLDAQKTDARQSNHTLLLSDNAVMDTKPQLEIYADDVKCTHGASVGSLDENSLFYLRSRGIGRDDALELLTFAFMNEILQSIPVDAIRSFLERRLLSTDEISA